MKKVTLAELRKKAASLGCGIEYDEDCQCYRATAPSGKCWEQGLHELVAVFGQGFIGNGETRADARADLFYRMNGYSSLEACEATDCDWCSHHEIANQDV